VTGKPLGTITGGGGSDLEIDAKLPEGIIDDAVLARLAESGVRVIEDARTGAMPQRKADVSRTDYFYVLHRNADGAETPARTYRSREFALLTLAAEAGQSLTFVEDGRRSGSHTLKRLANSAGRPGDVLETFLVRPAPTT
jgi:hypothetical protein